MMICVIGVGQEPIVAVLVRCDVMCLSCVSSLQPAPGLDSGATNSQLCRSRQERGSCHHQSTSATGVTPAPHLGELWKYLIRGQNFLIGEKLVGENNSNSELEEERCPYLVLTVDLATVYIKYWCPQFYSSSSDKPVASGKRNK